MARKYERKGDGLLLCAPELDMLATLAECDPCKDSFVRIAIHTLIAWWRDGAKADCVRDAAMSCKDTLLRVILERMMRDLAARRENYLNTCSQRADNARHKGANAPQSECEPPGEADVMREAKAAGIPADYATVFAKDMARRDWAYISRGATVKVTKGNLRAVLCAFHDQENGRGGNAKATSLVLGVSEAEIADYENRF